MHKIKSKHIEELNSINFYENRYVTIKCFFANTRIHKNVSHTQNKINAYEGEIVSITQIVQAAALPFDIKTSEKNSDEVREKFRYLDLRGAYGSNCLKLRNNVLAYARKILAQREFIEIETPVVTGSTPEGAKDFKVRSELTEGEYSLPQSPQIFKQILMLSDFTKYFQIAKCFRDENTRKNRLACEFTQLDLEFECYTVTKLAATMLWITKSILGKFSKKEVKVYRYTYDDIMKKYNTDKVNLILAEKFEFFVRNNHLHFRHYDIDKLTSFIRSKIKKVTIDDKEYYTYNTKEESYNELMLAINAESIHLNQHCLLIVSAFPYYELKNGDLVYAHNLFSKIKGRQTAKTSLQQKLKIRTYACDCIIDGQEIASGSIRSDVNIGKLPQFDFLYDIYKNYPTFQHGGFAIGIERLLCIVNNDENIKNYVAFFKLNNGNSTLPESPVTETTTEDY